MAEDTQTIAAMPQEPTDQVQQPNIDIPAQSQAPHTTGQVSQQAPENKKGLLSKIIKILILLAIAGALAAAAFFFWQKMQVKKRDTQRKQDLAAIKDGLEKMRQKTQNQKYYPSAISEATLVKTGIMDKVPQDPKNQESYVYQYRTDPPQCTYDCTGYTIYACLENANDTEGIDPIAPCTIKSYKVSSQQ